KRRWATGPFYNAWIVALLCYIGMVAGDTTGNLLSPGSTGLLVLAAAFFGYANFVLAGYFKDISADRATGYNTFPVRFGWIAAAIVSDVFATLAVIAVGALLVGIVPFPVTAVVTFFVPAVICSLIAQFRLHGIRDERMAHRSITFVVHGYILLLAGIAAALQPTWLLPLIAFFLLYLIVLTHRPLTAQI
ncbi:MAG: hypothetical protein JXA28_05650, partial [Bacteroidetes bacterium]|nr:hypothetical protein [Bacteroidota bacterium]